MILAANVGPWFFSGEPTLHMENGWVTSTDPTTLDPTNQCRLGSGGFLVGTPRRTVLINEETPSL